MEALGRQGIGGRKCHGPFVIHRIESALRRVRRALSRDEWSWRLLKLPPPEPGPSRHGLLLIQIDGLSAAQLEKALRAGRMPFVRSLMNREGYHRHSLYSGMPSTTPAAQGELFYGRRCCVPAFAYRARLEGPLKGRVMTLLNAESADCVEAELMLQSEVVQVDANTAGAEDGPLLAGGSAYSNIFTGGAREPHFCASRLSPLRVARHFHPLAFALVLLWNGASVMRLAALLGVEAVLAVYDALSGRLARREWRREFSFVFSRVLVCVGLREVVTAMASMDLARGLPVVHVNFPGYDEQAHRRGPASAFAQYALGGIDFCVRRLYGAAHRSLHRDYEVLIYSDHGQEAVLPYEKWKGVGFETAVRAALGAKVEMRSETVVRSQDPVGSRWEKRLDNLRQKKPAHHKAALGSVDSTGSAEPASEPVVLAYGPVGHIYLPTPCLPELRDRMAEALRTKAEIPMVLYALPAQEAKPIGLEAKAFTAEGVFLLPRDAAQVLGEKHPFLAATARDLVALCHHADAGDFVAVGWSPPGRAKRAAPKPLSFAWENGAHGGPGFEETHAFALLPRHVHVTPSPDGEPFRHENLRRIVQALQRRAGAQPRADERAPARRRAGEKPGLTVVTYNVHACLGMDGRLSPERIARVLAQTQGDIFCLQECFGEERGHPGHQGNRIAAILEHDFHFGPIQVMHDAYGNALLSTLPMREKKQAALPTVNGFTLEERGAQWAEVEWHGHRLQVLNTHLGLLGRERNAQAEALIADGWLPAALSNGPVVLAGDFNAGVRSAPFQTVSRLLVDAQQSLKGHRPRNTFFASLPVHRIDHVFMSRSLQAESIEVMRSHLTRLASDHLPVVVKLSTL
jgi:endonuclease/exonuclease/phosphatase family metal-dependent hydrolase